jgi:hypothetical protein
VSEVDKTIAMFTGVRGDVRQRERLINELLGLYSYCHDLELAAHADGDSDAEWEKVFNAVFEGGVSRRVQKIASELGIGFDWYDPDTTYEEDARAFINGLGELVTRFG